MVVTATIGNAKMTPSACTHAKGRATGGVRAQRFLKGETHLVLAWIGPRPVAANTKGDPRDLPTPTRAGMARAPSCARRTWSATWSSGAEHHEPGRGGCLSCPGGSLPALVALSLPWWRGSALHLAVRLCPALLSRCGAALSWRRGFALVVVAGRSIGQVLARRSLPGPPLAARVSCLLPGARSALAARCSPLAARVRRSPLAARVSCPLLGARSAARRRLLAARRPGPPPTGRPPDPPVRRSNSPLPPAAWVRARWDPAWVGRRPGRSIRFPFGRRRVAGPVGRGRRRLPGRSAP